MGGDASTGAADWLSEEYPMLWGVDRRMILAVANEIDGLIDRFCCTDVDVTVATVDVVTMRSWSDRIREGLGVLS